MNSYLLWIINKQTAPHRHTVVIIYIHIYILYIVKVMFLGNSSVVKIVYIYSGNTYIHYIFLVHKAQSKKCKT